MAPRGEPQNNHGTPGRQTKQSNWLSLPHQDDCKTRRDINNVQQNIEKLQNPTMGVTINKSTSTEPRNWLPNAFKWDFFFEKFIF